MKEIQKVLFPLDFSEVSSMVAPWVLMVTQKFKAELHLLFVARRLEHFVGVYVAPAYIQNFESEVIKGAEKKMEEFSEEHFKGDVPITASVVLGDASEEILRYIEAEKADLVVIGSHGRKGLDRVLFGSVADRVVKNAPVPVLSINPYRKLGDERSRRLAAADSLKEV